ncbi:hypothetical protein H072_552 [Dactylellina haptotyla CBS 200.50]|uniref:Transcription factor n=1 Tax=Dactylellina haptotyla (strain CBS 200.50) TaxID=1284197 RepID=S8C134_DACHA|nr:hypothetical protein H072_552 [Dactylellina haptotyla CBS 200.50]
MDSGEGSGGKAALGTGQGADFVKKLYRMLSDTTHRDVVRWSDGGASFIVFDNNEFTKNVLPQHFKHSNFASFVRQLNKYDFHKVRASDETVATGPNGDQAWEFVHPQFRLGNDGNIEGIKRKAPSQRPKKESEEPGPSNQEQQLQVSALQQRLDEVIRRVDGLVEQYHHVLQEVIQIGHHVRQNDAILDRIMREARMPPDVGHRDDAHYLNDGTGHPQMPRHGHHGPPPPPHHLSPQAMAHPPMQPQHGPPPPTPMHPAAATPIQQAERFLQHPPHPSHPQHGHSSSYSVMNGNGVPDPVSLSGFGNTASQSGIVLDATDPQISTTFRQETRRPQGLRKKSTGFVPPQWQEPPKVLLVEDDPTCRKIGLKFLEAAGCLGYYASDGYEAIKKFNDANGPQFDMILMDIVMPNLDGVSTTSIIRTAKPDMKDPPVIAMTSNIRASDINLYFNAGMIDVLPKPFTRDGLLQVLQKYLSPLLAHPDANGNTNGSNTLQPPGYSSVTPKQESKTSGSPPIVKSEYDGTTNSHADDEDEDDDGAHHSTPDSSVGIVPSTGISQNSHHHPHHQQHHHHNSTGGMDVNSDYTFSEMPSSGGGPGQSFSSNGSGGPGNVESEMLNASAGIYAPGLGGMAGTGIGQGSSPRGAVRRPMETGAHDEYGDPRMKRMRFNNAA